MWFPIAALSVTLAAAAFALARSRRSSARDRRTVADAMEDFVRLLADPARAHEVAFTAPLRFDEDRTHDTMFTARHGDRLLSFILDTSGMRIRWWALYERFAPGASGRELRVEATFSGNAIPARPIQELLKAARGERPAPPAPEPAPPPPIERHVDPFEAIEPDPSAPAVQA